MRNTLLASAAALGALLAPGLASAQMATIPNLLGGASAPNATSDFPTAGSVVVRLGGLVDWYAAAVSDSGDRSTKFAAGGAGVPANNFKKSTYTFGDYIRLFPTVDGVAANGLRYGVYSEFRVENALATGGGANAGVSATDRTNTLYVRRAYLYFGLQNAGYLRLGTGDGAGGLFDTGTFQNFDQGGWNGDIPNLLSGNTQVTFPFQGGVGAFYATNKLTYLSPQVAGFELGLSYEPNTSNVTDSDSANANSNSMRLASSSVAGDLHRRRNVINPELRYRATFGPVGVAAEAGYYLSGVVSNDGVATSSTVQYKGWNFYDGGLVLTFGGLSIGGHIMEGDFSGQGQLAPQGASAALAWIGGASYTIGPVIVGASYFHYNFSGNSGLSPTTTQGRLVGDEHDRGIAAGGTYTLIPGVSLFLSYVYGDKKEHGYDLINGAINAPGSSQGNQTRAQALGFGTQIRW